MSTSIQEKDTLTIYFVRKDGTKQEVKVPIGFTIMEAARKFANPTIDEIPADCGGCCACGTCHINIKEDINKVGPAEFDSMETELIQDQPEYDRMYSRLACQIMLEKKHNGLIVRVRDMENV
jgi:2Fe-2S ferredoxin